MKKRYPSQVLFPPDRFDREDMHFLDEYDNRLYFASGEAMREYIANARKP